MNAPLASDCGFSVILCLGAKTFTTFQLDSVCVYMYVCRSPKGSSKEEIT